MKYLGKFDELDPLHSDWKQYPKGSPAEGMYVQKIKDEYSIRKELNKYYNIESLKWIKVHKLRPGQEIKLHQDPAESRDDAHIIHFVLKTNPDVQFNLDGKDVTMEEGCIYEIDNTLPHFVKNNGKTDRIHIMVILYGQVRVN